MQFKKLAAVAGATAMSALSVLAAPVLASTVTEVGKISDMVTVTGSTVSFPMFVVGANAKTEDVAGAINVAVNMASYSKTTETIATTGSSSETVEGGVKIMTPGNELIPWTAMQSVKSVLTSSDMAILGDASYQTASGGSYQYKQYIYLSGEESSTTNHKVTFESPSGADPVASFKVTGNLNLTTYKMTFSTPVSLSSVTTTATLQAVLQGTTIQIMGKDFVISDCTYGAAGRTIADMTLIGGKNVITVASGEEKTVSVDGKDYIVKLDGVAQQTVGGTATYTAVGSVGGEAFELTAGNTKTLSDGTLVAAVKVIQGKTGEADFVKIAVGADKLKITDAGTVTKGTSTISELTSVITSTTANGWTGMKITHQVANDVYLKAGEKITNPFGDTFDLKFEGLTPAFDDETNRQSITFTPSTYKMLVEYKNAAGDVENFPTLYNNATTGSYIWAFGPATGTNTENSMRDFIFDEGQNISAIDDDYFVVSKSGFSRVLQFTTLTAEGLTFTDVNSNTLTSANTSATAGTLIVDGNSFAYYILNGNTAMTIRMDLNGDGYIGETASASVTPAKISVGNRSVGYSYLTPKLITSGQGGLYFYNGSANLTLYTGANVNYQIAPVGFGSIAIRNVSNVVTLYEWSAGTWTATGDTITIGAGLGEQSVTDEIGNIDYTLTCVNQSAAAGTCNITLGTSNSTMKNDRGFVLVEEAQQGSTTHNWIYLPVSYDGTNTRVYMTTVASDDANYANSALAGGAQEYQGMTTYGTLVKYFTTTGGGSASVSYPDSFTYGNLYVMTPEGTVITTVAEGEGVSADKVLAITTDVVKLDSEFADKSSITSDVVIVGGPCVNKVAAWVLGVEYPACGAASGIPENKAIVKVVKDAFTEGKTALLIAGWEAANTDFACQVVQNGGLDGKTADSVTVSGSVVSSPTIE
ncbi:MAG: hypothetical protein PHU12_00265 [Candidatus Aenigmarchaeota archaeon]|nr:hypothetical protein [Candidatus Aenigmarchaeota archaeon]